jgi:hypothetical protein
VSYDSDLLWTRSSTAKSLTKLSHQIVLNISGFSESTTGDIKTGFPSDGEPFTDGYDYTSDSDLDSDEDSDAVLAADRNLLRRNTAPTQEAKLIVRPAAERVPSTYSMSSAYSGYSSMSAGSTASSTTLGPDHSSSSNPFPGMGATSGGSTSASTPSTQSKVNDTIPIPIERSGRTIHVKDMAYRTWQSLIFYLYTGDIAVSGTSPNRWLVAESWPAHDDQTTLILCVVLTAEVGYDARPNRVHRAASRGPTA